ncbi:AraC family transcriptional regulator [Paenibacillus oralis]|uniref:AraC family transcriptional regulator n=1 Tax=Paenibacillus oralis TaxID=2490856 RepID=A0A3P3U4C4_9BACL|nr:AraC family transcriptional regulator [Paenibacillus oralis]RRJ64646.1 AraC family transcriptional regulator [Paenibacillus oralis]
MIDLYIPQSEPGIVWKNGVYFHEASDVAKSMFFYVFWGGEYYCRFPYKVDRDYMNSFILFSIREGSLAFNYRDQQFTASAGDIVLLDCRYRNYYYAVDDVRFHFFHFSGPQSEMMCEELYKKAGCLFSGLGHDNTAIPAIIDKIAAGNPDDFDLSVQIYQLLVSLFKTNYPAGPKQVSGKRLNPDLRPALDYIHAHYAEKLYVEQLSKLSNLSLYHFVRLFKKEMGVTPHHYVLNLRLKKTKQLLVETNLTVEEISARSGFNNVAHFIRTFSKSTGGLTPGKFRKMRF